MLIVGDVMFLHQFWMRTSKKYVSKFLGKFFKVKRQGQSSKNLKMPCFDLKLAAFDKTLDFKGEIHPISEFYTQRFSIFLSEV